MKTIIRAAEAADMLGISMSTLYKWSMRRNIPHMKKGKLLFFKREELEEWLQDSKVKTEDEIEQEAATELLRRKLNP